MKRIFLFGTLACAIGLYSCKKEDKTITVTETINDTLTNVIFPSGKIDANTLTAGLKAGYGTSVADSVFPAASTDADAPKLDPLYDKTYTTMPNSLLTILPANLSGTVAGYYVQVVGASSYFKIDYSTATARHKAVRKAQGNNARGYGEGFVDSTILFHMPATVNGDTFYIKYAAYDDQNRVSNATTALVIVKASASGAIVDSLKGAWSWYSERAVAAGETYNIYYSDTSHFSNFYNYDCADGVLTANTSGTYYYADNYYKYFNGYIFGEKASVVESSSMEYYELDLTNSSCSDTVYTYNEDNSYHYQNDYIGYTFDATTRKISIVYGYDSNNDEYGNGGNAEIYYDTYYVYSITDKELVLVANNYYGNSPYTYYYTLRKQ